MYRTRKIVTLGEEYAAIPNDAREEICEALMTIVHQRFPNGPKGTKGRRAYNRAKQARKNKDPWILAKEAVRMGLDSEVVRLVPVFFK